MKALERRGIVRDPIHGFMEIKNIEYDLIQYPLLRRLHDIKQLGLSHLVFPGATHSRFSHSLGVMEIAGRIAKRLVEVARRGKYCGYFFEHCDRGTEEFIEVARLAGLLHDIGHPPLSHQLEISLIELARMRALQGDESLYEALLASKGSSGGKLHEAYTKTFLRRLVGLIEDEEYEDFVKAAAAVLGGISKREAADSLERLGLATGSVDLIRSIISHEIVDADRLDYLIRDAHMCGVVFGHIDIERLLVGLELDDSPEGPVITVHSRSMQTVEDIFDARYKMYKTVYYHHKSIVLNVALTRVLEAIVSSWDEVAPDYLREYLGGPEGLYSPERIASMIIDRVSLFTDHDFTALVSNLMSKGDRLAKRWARSILADRWLLPISLIKRPDSFIMELTNTLGVARNENDDFELTETISKELGNLADEINSRFKEKIASVLTGVNMNSVVVEVRRERVVGSDVSDEFYSRSIYVRFLSRLGRIHLIFAYVYSDYENVHRELYRERSKLRRIYREAVIETLTNALRR